MNYETQSSRIAKLQSENAKQLLGNLRQAVMECIVIPNETQNLGELPDTLKNHKTLSDDGTHGPTLAQIQKKLDRIKDNPIRRKKAERKRRIALYAAMHENNSQLGNEFEFEYEPIDEFSEPFDSKKFAMAIAKAIRDGK